MELNYNENWQTQTRGTNDSEYQMYLVLAVACEREYETYLSGRVKVWRAIDEAYIIQMASEVHDFCHEEWTMENAVDCFGDEIPDEYNDILKKDKKVMVIGWSGQTECYPVADADSEIDLNKYIADNDSIFGGDA